MRIGTIGSGKVATTLGAALSQRGHRVTIGSRNPQQSRLAEWVDGAPESRSAAHTEEAVTGADLVILAVNPWSAIEQTLVELNAALADKKLLDLSNDINFGERPTLADATLSMGERVQLWSPRAKVVKTLNLVPAEMMVDPGLNPSVMWVSGDDSSAKATAAIVLRDLGWSTIIDLGGISTAKTQEGMGLLLTAVISSILKR